MTCRVIVDRKKGKENEKCTASEWRKKTCRQNPLHKTTETRKHALTFLDILYLQTKESQLDLADTQEFLLESLPEQMWFRPLKSSSLQLLTSSNLRRRYRFR